MRRKQHKQIQKLQYGDQKLYRRLCEKYYEQLLHYALMALKSPALAEAVLKDTFIDVWQNRHNLNPDIAFNLQLHEVLERHVFEMLHKMVEDEEVGQEIRDHIGKKLRSQTETMLDKEQVSVIDAIHNELLQQQLLHELATTRR